jgi:hypothetical protein
LTAAATPRHLIDGLSRRARSSDRSNGARCFAACAMRRDAYSPHHKSLIASELNRSIEAMRLAITHLAAHQAPLSAPHQSDGETK